MAKLKKIYLGIIIVFLYAPILVLIAQSFNASRYRGQWTGFTLQWYEKLFTSEDIIEAFLNTLTIGLTAAFFATLRPAGASAHLIPSYGDLLPRLYVERICGHRLDSPP